MKRWILFEFDDYYPCGGWGDMLGAYDDEDEARAAAIVVTRCDYGHDRGCENRELVDMMTLTVVAQWRSATTWEDTKPVKLRRTVYKPAVVEERFAHN